MPMPIQDPIYIGDVVRMRKPHPCGSYVWEVYRVGADIGLTCRQCGRRTLMSRRHFTHRMQTMLQRGPMATSSTSPQTSMPS